MAAWVGSIAAVLMSFLAMGTVLWRAGQRDGKLDQLLEQLVNTSNDHEARLRLVEGRRGGAHRAR